MLLIVMLLTRNTHEDRKLTQNAPIFARDLSYEAASKPKPKYIFRMFSFMNFGFWGYGVPSMLHTGMILECEGEAGHL